ncbi:MAG: hypothetical protein AAB421_01750 [Patescibacteria group bacterium]
MQKGFINVLLLIFVLIVAGGAFFALRPLLPAQGDGIGDVDMSGVNEAHTDVVVYQWIYEDQGEDSAGAPTTKVSLITGGRKHDIGVFQGSCNDSNTDLLEGEQMKVVCWWAGGGKEIGIFTENGVSTVRVGDVDEGSAEAPGFRGNFKVVTEL